MRIVPVVFVGLSVLACAGGGTPVEPEPGVVAPEPEVAPEPPAPSGAFPSSSTDARALLPADAATTPIVNEISGETVGSNVTLTARTDVAGLPCAAGEVSITDESWGCTLGAPWTFGAWSWPAGAWVGRHYGTGQPLAVVLASLATPVERLDFDGVPCAEFAHLHPDGHLSRCSLAVDHEQRGLSFLHGTQIGLDPSGAPIEAVFYETHTFGGRTYAPGTVLFDSSGAVTEHRKGGFGD